MSEADSNLLATAAEAAPDGAEPDAAPTDAPGAEAEAVAAEAAGEAAETAGEAEPGAVVPETPEGYELSFDHGLFEADPAVNERLHELGLSNDQAQAVYDLAAEKLVPLVESVAQEFETSRQREKLEAAFGGAQAYDRIARQIDGWARQNLPDEARDALARSYDGVMALYRMMTAGGEPSLGRSDGAAEGGDDVEALAQLMRDPRYWRDRDPTIVQQVTEGFRRLYPDS